MTLALIDYGAGNLYSVRNALVAAGCDNVVVTADPDVVNHADRIVLPGVGAFQACAAGLKAIPGMIEAMEGRVFNGGRPFLGICVGMQLMAEYGLEHGTHDGMGWVAGYVAPIQARPDVHVPHMGWNDVLPVGSNPLLVEKGEAYFLHSYAYQDGTQSPSPVSAVTNHGGEVVAAIQTETAVGIQFHPEKSQSYGLALLKRFLDWRP